MELLIYPNPILSKKCIDVKIGDQNALRVLDEMAQKLYELEGAGLAAPQVGVLKRMAVIDIRDDPPKLYKLINPRIVWKSEEMVESKEGCLSLPVLREAVERYEAVTVEYLDENFEKQEITADGFLSCCFQHELDHLNGILYIDHLSRLKKSRAIQKFYKLQNDNDSIEENE